MLRRPFWIVTIGVASFLCGCAPSIHTQSTSFEALTQQRQFDRRLNDQIDIRLDTGYRRTLTAGSTWRLAGRVPQGDVYAPVGTVLTIEGRQVHEAWLVVREDALLGFYLPGESTYSSLSQPILLPLGASQ